jgi:hypothetical protein
MILRDLRWILREKQVDADCYADSRYRQLLVAGERLFLFVRNHSHT